MVAFVFTLELRVLKRAAARGFLVGGDRVGRHRDPLMGVSCRKGKSITEAKGRSWGVDSPSRMRRLGPDQWALFDQGGNARGDGCRRFAGGGFAGGFVVTAVVLSHFGPLTV